MKPDLAVTLSDKSVRVSFGKAPKAKPGETVVVNPDLSVLKGVPPHLWELSADKRTLRRRQDRKPPARNYRLYITLAALAASLLYNFLR